MNSKILLLLVSILVLAKFDLGIAMNFEVWKKLSCPSDTLKCFDGHCCKFGEQYCSTKSETCEQIFSSKQEIKERRSICCNNFRNTNISANSLDISNACSYLFGKYNLAKECNGNKESRSELISEPVMSNTTKAAWCIVGITLGIIIIMSCIVVYQYRQIKKSKQEINGIKASPKDKNLSLQKRLSQEQISLLNQSVEVPTQVKELLQNRSNSNFNETVEDGHEEREENHASQFVLVDEACTPPHVTNQMPQLFSPADNHGNTIVSPSGERYKC